MLYKGAVAVDQHNGGDAPNGAVPANEYSGKEAWTQNVAQAQGQAVLAPYETKPAPKGSGPGGEEEVSWDERVLAARQAEAARLENLARLGFDVTPQKKFEYSDQRELTRDVAPEILDALEDLDFPDDEVDENGDIIDEDDVLSEYPDAVPVPTDVKRGPGRPRKN